MSKYIGLSTLEVLEDARNYNNWIADSISSYIKAPVMEIGAGTGNLTSFLIAKKPLYVTDIDAELVSRLKKGFKGADDVIIDRLDILKKIPIAYRSFFSTVFSINVLEHIQDDEEALRNMNKLLKKKGRLVLLVPAKKFAFSKLDKELGHVRRYEKNEIIGKLKSADFTIQNIFFLNIVGLLSWYIRDKLKRKNILIKPYQIRIFDAIVPLLRKIESGIKVPIGISLIVVAEKQ